MPFSSNSELPQRVRDAVPSQRGRSLFREVVNSTLEEGRSESVAFASAWGALQNAGFEQNSEGKWVKKQERYTNTATVLKADAEQRIVWGWASVVTEKGEPVVDAHGDVIPAGEMTKMANDFMKDARLAKAMHEGEGIGEVLHSLPLTKDLAEALGLETEREGWIVGMHVHDDATWERVKSGELGAFSIGGSAQTEEIEDA